MSRKNDTVALLKELPGVWPCVSRCASEKPVAEPHGFGREGQDLRVPQC